MHALAFARGGSLSRTLPLLLALLLAVFAQLSQAQCESHVVTVSPSPAVVTGPSAAYSVPVTLTNTGSDTASLDTYSCTLTSTPPPPPTTIVPTDFFALRTVDTDIVSGASTTIYVETVAAVPAGEYSFSCVYSYLVITGGSQPTCSLTITVNLHITAAVELLSSDLYSEPPNMAANVTEGS